MSQVPVPLFYITLDAHFEVPLDKYKILSQRIVYVWDPELKAGKSVILCVWCLYPSLEEHGDKYGVIWTCGAFAYELYHSIH